MLADGAPVTGQGGPGTAALGGRTTTAAPAGPAGPAVPVAPQAAQQAATPATHQTAQQAMRWRDLHQRCGPLRRPLVADGLLLALLRLDSARVGAALATPTALLLLARLADRRLLVIPLHRPPQGASMVQRRIVDPPANLQGFSCKTRNALARHALAVGTRGRVMRSAVAGPMQAQSAAPATLAVGDLDLFAVQALQALADTLCGRCCWRWPSRAATTWQWCRPTICTWCPGPTCWPMHCRRVVHCASTPAAVPGRGAAGRRMDRPTRNAAQTPAHLAPARRWPASGCAAPTTCRRSKPAGGPRCRAACSARSTLCWARRWAFIGPLRLPDRVWRRLADRGARCRGLPVQPGGAVCAGQRLPRRPVPKPGHRIGGACSDRPGAAWPRAVDCHASAPCWRSVCRTPWPGLIPAWQPAGATCRVTGSPGWPRHRQPA